MKFDPRMVTDPEEFFLAAIADASSQEALVELLEALLTAGFGVWEDGRLYNIRARVDRVRGLTIHVFPRDHDPPHFHVVGPGVNAKFGIESCQYLGGPLGHHRRDIIEWFLRNGGRAKALALWEQTRPSTEAS